MEVKTFRIVKIIDENNVVVNAGSSDVGAGQNLEIFVEGQEVIDPETKEPMGVLDFVKATVRVVNVFPKMCICTNAENRIYNPIADSLSQFHREITLPLNIDTKEISGGFENVDKKIKVGDTVRKPL